MNIYIHIPFCHSKCAYCAFLSHCDITKEDEYVKVLCKEIEDYKLKIEDSVKTIYFGGGTPSLIKPENITKIIETLESKAKFAKVVEITLECNPEDITEEKLRKWKDAGINRLSIGIQTFDDNVRKTVGRTLATNEAIQRVELAQRYFKNVGIDLISGLPGESSSSLEKHKLFLKTLSHVSLYDLETDNDSAIGKHPESFDLPKENIGAEMLVSAWDLLTKLGFEQYEISNFARDGKYCRHNLDFWQGKDYIGFGLGAASRKGSRIITNTSDFEDYLSGNYTRNEEILSPLELKRFCLLSAVRLNQPFKKQLLAVNGNANLLDELFELELVTNDYILTRKGKLMYNQVVNKLLQ